MSPPAEPAALARGGEGAGAWRLRAWWWDDAPALARHANSQAVSRNLRDRFPHPYTLGDAYRYLARVVDAMPVTSFCVEVDGEAAGGISLAVGADIERCSAELGYWLGEPFWSRGIMSAAVRRVAEHALETLGLERVFAVPFASNAASARVLEKAGFVREGVMRRAAVKDGRVHDLVLYARVRAPEAR